MYKLIVNVYLTFFHRMFQLLTHFDRKYPHLKDAFMRNWHKETQLILQKAIQNLIVSQERVKSLTDLG